MIYGQFRRLKNEGSHQRYAIPSFLVWRSRDNIWYGFIKDIRQAGQFAVYGLH
ncbi:hypothetical protein ACEU59_17020 [Buttiauxella noackiae]|uniref:hypothetical protein n=1 Tax=Buttiauxella noackiae TaxID=82992 RepID=UPI0035A6867E